MTNNEEQALKDFLLDIDCLKQLDDWTDDFNLFDVLRITNMEIRHSNILAWIFDPNESHGLGDSFIKSFITNAIQEVIDDRDYEMQEVLDDYLNYCYNDGLITVSDSWKFMRMQLAGATLDFNVSEDIYYDNVERGFRAHDYLSLYKNKSVRAVGKICARIVAVETEEGMQYEAEYGELTEERKRKILLAITDGDEHGYDLRTIKHRYFFVEKFYETDFKKITPRAPMGSRVFDLTQILEMQQLPATQDIAELLKTKTWN